MPRQKEYFFNPNYDTPATVFFGELTTKVSEGSILTPDQFQKFYNSFIDDLPKGQVLNLEEVNIILGIRVIVLSASQNRAVKGHKVRYLEIEIAKKAYKLVHEYLNPPKN